MDAKHSTEASPYQKATAWVYRGAAFLVLLLGMRAIAETSPFLDEYKVALTALAFAALVLEFALLLFYAQVIQRNGTASSTDTPQNAAGGGATLLPNETVETLNRAAASLQTIANSLEGIISEQTKTAAIAEVTEKLRQALRDDSGSRA